MAEALKSDRLVHPVWLAEQIYMISLVRVYYACVFSSENCLWRLYHKRDTGNVVADAGFHCDNTRVQWTELYFETSCHT